MNKIIVIIGPTGVGKTKLSIELAKKLNGEIINGDAIQVYKHLDIGSAKVTESEKENIPHHLFDIKEVNEEYSIYDYQIDCRNKIKEIQAKNKTVIIVGGTGLYIKSALYNYTLEKTPPIKNDYEELSTEELYHLLLSIDPDTNLDKHNRRRIIRAINYYNSSNKSITTNNDGSNLLYDAIFIGLTTDRSILYNRINMRVDKMFNDGLLEEVKSFYDKSIREKPLMSGIGYKELYRYFDNEISLDEAIDLIKRNSRRYAKRQYTFFNHQFKTNWFNVDFDNFNNTVDEVYNFINNGVNHE